MRNFVSGLLERVRAIPGVAAAGATNALPFTDRNNASAMAVEGYNAASGELPPVPRWSTIDAGYLPAMKIPLRAGRYFREGDTADIAKGRRLWTSSWRGNTFRRARRSAAACVAGSRPKTGSTR